MATASAPDGDADPVLDKGAVLSLVRQHIPGAQALTGVDESGRKGRVYLVDDAIVVKTHRPARLRARRVEEFETDPEKEAFFIGELTRNGCAFAPRLLGAGRWGEVRYVCMTRVAGVAIRRAAITRAQRLTALQGLGRALRTIHELPQERFRASGLFPEDGPDVSLAARLANLGARLAEAIRLLPPEWWPLELSPEDVVERALRTLPASPARAVLHSNPAGEHVFVDPTTGELSGLIDYGDAYISRPAFDLRPWRKTEEAQAILDGYWEGQKPEESFMASAWVARVFGSLASIARGRGDPAATASELSPLLAERGP